MRRATAFLAAVVVCSPLAATQVAPPAVADTLIYLDRGYHGVTAWGTFVVLVRAE